MLVTAPCHLDCTARSCCPIASKSSLNSKHGARNVCEREKERCSWKAPANSLCQKAAKQETVGQFYSQRGICDWSCDLINSSQTAWGQGVASKRIGAPAPKILFFKRKLYPYRCQCESKLVTEHWTCIFAWRKMLKCSCWRGCCGPPQGGHPASSWNHGIMEYQAGGDHLPKLSWQKHHLDKMAES